MSNLSPDQFGEHVQYMPLGQFRHVVSEDNYHAMHEQESVPIEWPSPSGLDREELFDSVRKHGIKTPVEINAKGGGEGDWQYEAGTLHGGHHRAAAAIHVGIDPVPYVLHHCPPSGCRDH